MNRIGRRMRAAVNPVSTAATRWWCHSAVRHVLTGHGPAARQRLIRDGIRGSGFTPSPGRIAAFHSPGGPGVRVDTAAYQGYVIPPHYDSLIAKLIVSGRDRAEAISRGRRALDLFVVEGVQTTIPMHRRILDEADFLDGRLSTRFMERFARAS